MESPKAINLYRFTFECGLGENTYPLPDYFETLNTEASVHVSAANCFGMGYGRCSTDGSNTVLIVVNAPGTYHIHVYADRNDQAVRDEFSKYGIEYDPLLVNASAE